MRYWQVFTPWGLLSGLFFVLSMAITFLAIARLGLGSATGIWSGTAIVVSFTWGVKVQVCFVPCPLLRTIIVRQSVLLGVHFRLWRHVRSVARAQNSSSNSSKIQVYRKQSTALKLQLLQSLERSSIGF